MTDSQKQALARIWDNLRAKTDGKTLTLPLICYALDPGIISEEDYEELRELDIASPDTFNEWHYTNGGAKPSMALPLILLWVRRFYECSDGKDVFPVLQSLSVKTGLPAEAKNRWAYFIHKEFARFGISEVNANQWRDWMLSQCWVIKAEDRGQTSGILDDNASVLDYLSEETEDKELTASLLDTPDQMGARMAEIYIDEAFPQNDTPEYLKGIWSSCPVVYAISLCALTEKPDSPHKERALAAHPWLTPLWGKAVGMRGRSVSIGWALYDNGYYELCLLYSTGPAIRDGELKLQQGGRKMGLKAGKNRSITMRELVKKGFDLGKSISLGTGRHPILPLTGGVMVFAGTGTMFHTLLRTKAYLPRKKAGGLCILTQTQPAAVTLGGKSCTLRHDYHGEIDMGKDGRIICYVYDLPEMDVCPQTKIPLEITTDGETRIPLTFDKRPELCIENRVEGLRDPMRPQMAIVVGREVLIRMGGDQGGRAVPVTDFPPRSRKRVSGVGYGGVRCPQDVLLLPPDWKEHATSLDGSPLYEAMLSGGIPYRYTLANNAEISLVERVSKPVAVWTRDDALGTDYRIQPIQRYSQIEKEDWVLRTYFPRGCARELTCKVAGQPPVTFPLETGSLYADDLHDMLEGKGLTHGRHIVLSIGDTPVFNGHIRVAGSNPQVTPEQQLADTMRELLHELDALEGNDGGNPSAEGAPTLKVGTLKGLFENAVLRAYSTIPLTRTELRKTRAWGLMQQSNALKAPAETQTFRFACILLITSRNWQRGRQHKCPAYLAQELEFMQEACDSYLDASPACLAAVKDAMLKAAPYIEKR